MNLEDLRSGHITSCGCVQWDAALEVVRPSGASQAEMAWAAGFIDGEGCIHIRVDMPSAANKNQSPHYALVLQVSNTNLPSLERLREIFGCGSIRSHHPTNPAHSEAYIWYCLSHHANRVISLLYDFLFVKKSEAALALEFYRLPAGRRGRRKADPDLIAMRADLCHRLREMKPGFRFRYRKY